MKRLRQLIFRYGTSAALLLMCAALSFLTLGDQHPTGEAAAQQLARRLRREFPSGAAGSGRHANERRRRPLCCSIASDAGGGRHDRHRGQWRTQRRTGSAGGSGARAAEVGRHRGHGHFRKLADVQRPGHRFPRVCWRPDLPSAALHLAHVSADGQSAKRRQPDRGDRDHRRGDDLCDHRRWHRFVGG